MTVRALRETSVITEQFIKDMQGYFCQKDLDLIKRASTFAEDHYANIVRPTGKPYLQYTFEVARYLVESDSGAVVVSAAIVYPPPSAGKVLDELKKIFKGENELLEIVEEVLHIGHLEWNEWPLAQEPSGTKERREILKKMFLLAINETKDEDHTQDSLQFQKREKQAENLIRMFLAAATDIRALVIKLVDRLYFIKFLKDLEPSKQQLINYKLLAKITLEIYAALADRLGMWRLKSELEDMSFRLLEPEKYKAIAQQIESKKRAREDYITGIIIPMIRNELEAYGIKAEIFGRAKHIYSIFKKMEAKQLSFEQINDLLGVRIIVDKEEDCYTVQSILHEYWEPLTEPYEGKAGRDWIANPKENLYQSLHTTILIQGKAVEVQIRTRKMHEIAEYGVTALNDAVHWRYKESKTYRKAKTPKGSGSKDRSERLAELRRILKGEQEAIISMVKDLLEDRIFVITPEGHVIDLSAHATPLDFAYRIHTSLGHMYAGAKVGDRYVRIDHELKNGDIVEIITSRARKGPNPEWLSKSKLDDQLGNDEFLAGIREDFIPQWLYRREEGNKSKDKESTSESKDETISKDMEDYMYYVFARTRQARSKIQKWLKKDEIQKSKQNDVQKPKRNESQKPKTQK